jgi:hypothetical protein
LAPLADKIAQAKKKMKSELMRKEAENRAKPLVEVKTEMLGGSRFLEVFRGAGALTQAVKETGIEVGHVEHVVESPSFDLASGEQYRKLRKAIRLRKFRWVHFAPPCSTFSTARRVDRKGAAPPLRSAEEPLGMSDVDSKYKDRLKEANRCAIHTAKLARLCVRMGVFFSVENPAKSLLWQLSGYKALMQLKTVEFVEGDQCPLGSIYKKATGWCTNAPFLAGLGQRCPGQPEHPVHEDLSGHYVDELGKRQWVSRLGSEYCEVLAKFMADAFKEFVEANPKQDLPIRKEFSVDGTKLASSDSVPNRFIREQENRNCLGGMRCPHLAADKCPGWLEVGPRIRRVVQNCMDHSEQVWNKWAQQLGQTSCPELPAKLVQQCRADLAQEFNVDVWRKKVCKATYLGPF